MTGRLDARPAARRAAALAALAAMLLAAFAPGCTDGERKPRINSGPKASEPGPDYSVPDDDIIVEPHKPVAVTPPVVFEGFAPEGEGHPTQFVTNCPAVLTFPGGKCDLPCTLWFDDRTAPDGETPFTYKMKPGGSGTYDLLFAGDKPCTVTTPEGGPLTIIDLRFSTDETSGGRIRSVFRMHLSP